MVLLFPALLPLGCKDANPLTGESPSNIVFPATGVKFGLHVQPLFDQTCALVGCHDNSAHQSALKLDNYGDLVFNAPQTEVVRGKPDASVLVLRIQGTTGTRMPPYGNPLNQNQVNGIRTWIAEGANNN